MQLRPVSYQFDVKRFDEQSGFLNSTDVINVAYDEASRIRRSGFIAQEVEKAADATGYNFSGVIKPKTEKEHYSLSYDAFVIPLVKGMQEQQVIITHQEKLIRKQQEQIDQLQRQQEDILKLLKTGK
jgi:hypothetical protein